MVNIFRLWLYTLWDIQRKVWGGGGGGAVGKK